MLGKTNATVSTGGSGGGGATVQAVNKTGSAISTGDKVWLNQGGITTTEIGNRSGKYSYGYYLFDNPNKLYWFGDGDGRMNGIYIATINEDGSVSDFTSSFSITNSPGLWVDEDNNLILGGMYGGLYNLTTDAGFKYVPSSGSTYYRWNKYFVNHSNSHSIIKLDDEQEVLNTYTKASTTLHERSGVVACVINDTTMVGNAGVSPHYLSVITLNDETSTYTVTPTTFTGYVIGRFSEPDIIFTRSVEDYSSHDSLLKCYKYNNGNIELIDPEDLPSGMALCYTEGCRMFVNAHTKTFTAYLATSKKLVAYQWVNGEWIDISPVINNLPEAEGYAAPVFSISSDHTRAIYNGYHSQSYYGTQYIYNLATINQYMAVPYVYTNSGSITGFAKANAATDASFEANVAGAVS